MNTPIKDLFALAEEAIWPVIWSEKKALDKFKESATPERVREVAEAFRALEQRAEAAEAELVPQDYFASLVSKARTSADKAMVKFPQPNYVLLKVAEEAGEVVQAGVHYAENRMTWQEVEGEITQLLAMLIRLVTEGDQVNGITPPEICRNFRPAPAVSLAELVPPEADGSNLPFAANGWNACRSEMLRNIEEANK